MIVAGCGTLCSLIAQTETPLFQKAYSRIVPENTNKAVKIAENMQDDAHVVKTSIGQYERAWGLVSDACVKMATKAELAGALLVRCMIDRNARTGQEH